MAFDDLRSFLKALDEQGQLLEIDEEVLPNRISPPRQMRQGEWVKAHRPSRLKKLRVTIMLMS